MNTPIPKDFLETSVSIFGRESEEFLASLDSEPSLGIHINTEKMQKTGVVIPDNAERVEWTSNGFYLKSRPRFTFDPFLHAGAYYVEEPSSMFVEKALNYIQKDIRIDRALDLCAAPGGKSIMIRNSMKGGLLVSNEPLSKRAAVLTENLAKWGNPDIIVTSDFPEAFDGLTGFFDLIATDVPCSGEGMFRKDETARSEWSKANVENCVQRQRDILRTIWPTLRKGGYIIYSTCTFNRREDEENVLFIANELGAEILNLETDADWHICGDTTGRNLPVYHFFPHKTRGEGFFLALLKKISDTPPAENRKSKKKKPETVSADGFAEWINCKENFDFHKSKDGITALRKAFADDYAAISEKLNVICAGVRVCTEKPAKFSNSARKPKPQFVPAPGLALSSCLNRKAFPDISLNYSDAIKFLRGESIPLTVYAPRGWVTVSYRNLPLGFANNVGSRLNNSYPPAWRIRSTYVPDSAPQLEF